MIREVKRVKIFTNDNKKSQEISLITKEKLEKVGFLVVDNNPDLGIAIGGDGSFLRMVKETNFDSNIYYVGINAGTLGFLQEIKIEDIDIFIDNLKRINYKTSTIGVQETSVITNESKSFFYSLNEIVIRDQELNTTKLNVLIDNEHLENYTGDGLLIATSIGSTAYNLSFGGSIIFDDFHTLQITPIAPLNSKVYRNLLNSVIIPENRVITLIPEKDKSNLLITVDGENLRYNGVLRLDTVVEEKKITCLRFKENSFVNKVNDKFLK